MSVLDNYVCEGQMTIFDLLSPDSWCGKTYPERSAQTKEMTSAECLKKFAELRIKPPQFLYLGGGKWSTSGCIMGDSWSVAWRVHDAQFWGVPQRRKRIALVADFGGTSAPEILFERKGLSGDIEESREKGEGTAADTERGIDKAISFQERAGKPGGGKGILIQDERTGALSTLNNQSVCYGFCSMNSNSMKSSNPHSGIYEADTSRTLDLNGGNPACNQGGMMVVQDAVCIENHPQDSRVKVREDGVCQTLNSKMGTGGGMCRW